MAVTLDKQQQIEILQDKLRRIDERQAEIEATLPKLPKGTNVRQEMMIEKNDLSGLRRVTENQLRGLTMPPSNKQVSAQHRRNALVKLREAELRRDWLQQAAQFYAQNDFRSGRLMRLNALQARDYAEKEIQ
jgi:hypothetical protein